jgi:hypothetical protein
MQRAPSKFNSGEIHKNIQNNDDLPGQEFYNIDFNTFGPRVGISYSITPRTVIRSGAGVYCKNNLVTYTQSVPGNTLTGNETLTAGQNPGLGYGCFGN